MSKIKDAIIESKERNKELKEIVEKKNKKPYNKTLKYGSLNLLI